MMGITSKHRHHRRTTGGGKRWRKRNAHTERHESKSGMDTSMQNVRGASNGGMYPGSFRAGIYARTAAGKVPKNRQLLHIAIDLGFRAGIYARTAAGKVPKNRQLLHIAIDLAVFGLVFMPEMPPEMGKEQER